MSSFRKPPPIENLSELSWKRMEQSLERKLDECADAEGADRPVKNRLPWVAGGSLLVAAAASLALWLASNTTTKSAKAPAAESVSEVFTGESSTEVRIAGATVEVQPYSEVTVEQKGAEIAFHLRDGGIRLDVDPRDHRQPATVVAGDVRIEVVGTEFAVYRNANETQVVVYEGLVAVNLRGTRDLVKAGERWQSSTRTQITPLSVEAEPEAELPAATTAQNHQAKRTERPSTRALFEEAATKEHTESAEALRLYRLAAKGSGPWAANALFAQARLLLAEGRSEKAKTLLLRYLDRFPSGANATDVQSLLKGLQ